MYLYTHSAGSNRDGRTEPPTMLSRTVGREMLNAAICRTTMKDTTSSKLSVHGPKQADAVHKAELLVLRGELKALPEGLRENARMNYLLDQNIKRKDLQDFQCSMIGKVEAILRKNITESGQDYRKYKVGGYDKGTYERFFRVEPARYMSKAQLTTALRRSFGDTVIKSESAIGKLFDSFDFNRTDEMDWRAFLYMLSILMQPYLFCDALLRWGYAIYSSVGSLDLDCAEPLSLGMVKDMICVPVILSLRSYVKHAFDSAWLELSCNDTDTILYAARKTSTVAARAADPDDLKITFKILNKILTMTPFAKFMVTATVYGIRDNRSWTCVLEEQYYHPRVLRELKALRREERSNGEADKFVALRILRCKKYSLNIWREYTRQRNFIRYVLIGGEVRTQLSVYTLYFDHWRRFTLELQCRLLLQRVSRGFIARNRKRFIKRIRDKATLIQSGTRKLFARRSYTQKTTRIHWAVCTIQRLYRGIRARKRVANIVEARFDHEKRLLERARRVWMFWRIVRAFLGIQLYCRRYMKRVAETKREEQAARVAKMERAMAEEAEKARVAEEVYKANLSAWYTERKATYDLDVLNEHQTLADRKLILDRRGKAAALERAAKAKEREDKIARFEEEKTEIWLRTWEEKIARLGRERRARCELVLVQPETPEDLVLKNDLQKRIKAQIKDVLRRADKMKIPMEIPEAFENATKEIIDFECEAEMARAREVMRAEAEAIQKADEEKARKTRDDEERARQRRKKWAAMTMQGYVRAFLARRLLRQRAYKRFTKYFDVASHNYYYEDKRTHTMSWEKPASLGSYDIDMENYWIVMHATTGAGAPIMHTEEVPADPADPHSEKILREVPLVYYYNPSTWKQTWERPEGTILCEECKIEFAKRLLNYDQVKYCEYCFPAHAQALVDSGMHPKYVTFKPFQGGSEYAVRTDFYNTPDDSWFMLILDVNPALKQSEEEEVAAIKRARKKQLQSNKGSQSSRSADSSSKSSNAYTPQAGAKALLELCGICDDKIAVLSCPECETLYCKPCCDMEHSIASHAFHNVTTYIPAIDGGGDGSPVPKVASPPEASNKSRRKSRRKSSRVPPSITESGAESEAESGAESKAGPEASDADDESFLSQPNYGTGDEHSAASSPTKEKKEKKHKKSKGTAPGADDSATKNDADASTAGSKSRHKKKKKDMSGDKDSRAVASDAEGESSPDKKHKKKHKKSKDGAADDASTATGSTHRSKHKDKEKSKDKASKDKRHTKNHDGASVGGDATADTADESGSKAKSKHKSKHKSKDKNKHKSQDKEKKAKRQSGEESGVDTSAFSGLSDTDTGYDTSTSKSKDKKTNKHHHKSKSKDADSGADSLPTTPKKKHKHSKHSKDTKDKPGEQLGGDFSDAFAGMALSDTDADASAMSSPAPSSAHKKKHKKHSKDPSQEPDGDVNVVNDLNDLDYVPSEPQEKKKHKKHKSATPDKSHDKKHSKHDKKPSSAPDVTHHHSKHHKDKDKSGSAATSSGFKLPDIFKRNTGAGTASEGGNESGAEGNGGGGVFGKKEHKKKHHEDKTRDGRDSAGPSSPDTSFALPQADKVEKHKHRDRSGGGGNEGGGGGDTDGSGVEYDGYNVPRSGEQGGKKTKKHKSKHKEESSDTEPPPSHHHKTHKAHKDGGGEDGDGAAKMPHKHHHKH